MSEPRYWIHDSVTLDQPDIGMPFGDDTVGIVDEEEGGVILYVHRNRALSILRALITQAEVVNHDDGLIPPDPRFPDRPHTLDFARLSSAVGEQDALADMLGIEEALDVDLPSLIYMAGGRIQKFSAQSRWWEAASPRLRAAIFAIYFDAFQLGVGFQKRGGHRPDETGTAGEGSSS